MSDHNNQSSGGGGHEGVPHLLDSPTNLVRRVETMTNPHQQSAFGAGCASAQSPTCGSCLQQMEALSPRPRGRRRVSSRSDEQQSQFLKLSLIGTCSHHKNTQKFRTSKRNEIDNHECVHRHTDPPVHGNTASNIGSTLQRLPSFPNQANQVLRSQGGCNGTPQIQVGSYIQQQQLSEEEKAKTIDEYMREGERQVPLAGGVTLDQFKIIGDTNIGRGTYGQVKLVEREGKRFAMKLLDKEQITRLGKVDHVFREQNFLRRFSHPSFPRLYYTFQDAEHLYFIQEYVPNGSLQAILDQGTKLPTPLAKFYAASLVLGLEYLHHVQQIVHRDLKPQNILIDGQYYLKIIDFGDSKNISDEEIKIDSKMLSEHRSSAGSFSQIMRAANDREKQNRHGTFVGTPLYVAPEMLEYNHSGRYTDLWALGCIIYYMVVGKTPFQADNSNQVFQKIMERQLNFPLDMDSQAVDLINKLMDYNPENRLGMKSNNPFEGYDEIKKHPFFTDVDFSGIESRTLILQCFDLFSTHTDSDESSTNKRDDSGKKRVAHDDELKNIVDACCQQRAIELGKIHWQGEVRVRRKLFLQRRRHMILLQDGHLLLLKRNHIRTQYLIDELTEIKVSKGGQDRFSIKFGHGMGSEVVESPEAETWVPILLQIKQLVIQNKVRNSK